MNEPLYTANGLMRQVSEAGDAVDSLRVATDKLQSYLDHIESMDELVGDGSAMSWEEHASRAPWVASESVRRFTVADDGLVTVTHRLSGLRPREGYMGPLVLRCRTARDGDSLCRAYGDESGEPLVRTHRVGPFQVSHAVFFARDQAVDGVDVETVTVAGRLLPSARDRVYRAGSVSVNLRHVVERLSLLIEFERLDVEQSWVGLVAGRGGDDVPLVDVARETTFVADGLRRANATLIRPLPGYQYGIAWRARSEPAEGVSER